MQGCPSSCVLTIQQYKPLWRVELEVSVARAWERRDLRCPGGLKFHLEGWTWNLRRQSWKVQITLIDAYCIYTNSVAKSCQLQQYRLPVVSCPKMVKSKANHRSCAKTRRQQASLQSVKCLILGSVDPCITWTCAIENNNDFSWMNISDTGTSSCMLRY